ncbi:hypothetical protein CC2G_014102 [Coprinopsis cinerea AmutBmut pab1-1]|nr:hypothetical protein CC2G_014102 [Coprinopsis cinerea AmutBmut pab1-1]
MAGVTPTARLQQRQVQCSPPSSPMQPSSPNTQLTMQLLGNLMQMQGLDGGFALPSSAVPINSNSSGASDSGSNTYGIMSPFDMQQQQQQQQSSTNNPNPSSQNMLSSPTTFMGAGQNLPQSILEQQIKLQQLQQLQQLQNQIFQQQMALISSSPILSKTAPLDVNQQFQSNSSDQSQNGNYLPTPGPSTELRPQQQSMEFVSPMILNNSYMESESPNNTHNPNQRQQHSHSQSHTPSPMITSTYHPHDDAFSQPLPPPMAPQASMDYSQSHSNLHRGIASAPEHLAFDIRSGREFDLDVSPLTSPWLGAYGATPSNMRMSSHRMDTRGMGTNERASNGNKRAASPHNDEYSSRKKHSPAIGPTLANAGMLPPPSGSSSRRQSVHRTSKSTTSTPLLRGSRNRSKSGISGAPPTMTPLTAAYDSTPNAGGDAGMGQHQHTFSVSGTPHGGSGSLGGMPEDSPSPVDLSQINPSPPNTDTNQSMASSDMGGSSIDIFAPAPGTRLTPVTPASIMNLGRLGAPSSSVNDTGPANNTNPPSNGTTMTTRGSKGKGRADGNSKLKTILPAGDPNPKPAPDANFPPGQKKTSHKAAEQKRRDSLKTTFDDLRKLLPPIAFEDTIEEEGGGGSATGRSKDKVLPVRGPLLPGALPPRGPPKAGGDGPNKGVSKLQLLICGNQYIRTLKGRVDRRDEEIVKLRREVLRLRSKVGVLEGRLKEGGGAGMELDLGDMDGPPEDLDLERDLDEIEGMSVRIERVPGGAAGDEEEDEDA